MRDPAEQNTLLFLKRSVDAMLQEGRIEEGMPVLREIARKWFHESVDLQDVYIEECLKKKYLMTDEEFYQWLPEFIGLPKHNDPAKVARIIQYFSQAAAPPKVFISYSHDTPEHKQWVLRLATRLRQNGVDAILDQWDCVPPMDVTRFMEESLRLAGRVVIVCTERYLEKANSTKGGVGYERMIITGDLSKNLDTLKFIPIVRQKSGERPLPDFMGARIYIDFQDQDAFEDSLQRLLRVIHNEPEVIKPPIGQNPFRIK